ncbi:unnamed protein product [Rhizoctonia solani]|uniref:Uncharacterized protein n=1 Tax=Rhizoctonia solani TaxID=456999 RepID=A0A8H3DZM8_9AGAM|nr:unnamed protein product [Rhizoctonia solani]
MSLLTISRAGKDHPTLQTPERAVEVLSRFSFQFVPISIGEGLNRVYSIAPNGSADYTREELENILAAVRASPFIPSPDSLPPVSISSRGRGGRGHGHRGQPPGSHAWRSHHASPSWVPPRETAQQGTAQQDNWRTRGPETSRPRGRGRGGYRGRASYGNYGAYPRGGGPPGTRDQTTPRPMPPVQNPDVQPLSDVPGSA